MPRCVHTRKTCVAGFNCGADLRNEARGGGRTVPPRQADDGQTLGIQDSQERPPIRPAAVATGLCCFFWRGDHRVTEWRDTISSGETPSRVERHHLPSGPTRSRARAHARIHAPPFLPVLSGAGPTSRPTKKRQLHQTS